MKVWVLDAGPNWWAYCSKDCAEWDQGPNPPLRELELRHYKSLYSEPRKCDMCGERFKDSQE